MRKIPRFRKCRFGRNKRNGKCLKKPRKNAPPQWR